MDIKDSEHLIRCSQNNKGTGYNRYPEIFTDVVKNVNKNPHLNKPRILSFGCSCSAGKVKKWSPEVKSLHDLYFPNSHIDGLDVDKSMISQLNKNNDNPLLNYFDSSEGLSTYDVIFCMSVLCRNGKQGATRFTGQTWDGLGMKRYPFEQFNTTITVIDKLLNLNGYLCIYNSKYMFTETSVANKYTVVDPIDFDTKPSVHAAHRHGKTDPNYNYRYYLFNKKKLK